MTSAAHRSQLDRLAAQRLAAQQLTMPTYPTPAALVAHLVAVQAQDYAACKWALGTRLPGATDSTVERALEDGTILRTHAFRGTWQLVTPADIRWLLALIGPRVLARSAPRHRQLGLDARTLRRAADVIARVLRDRGPLTRTEIAAALTAARISPEGQRLPHLLAHAELQALICSGSARGYSLLEDRAPPRAPLDPRDAAAQLARRYFLSRGPATLADFVWWSGLPAGDARTALESVQGQLVAETIDRTAYWRSGQSPIPPRPTAHLLPAFDEYLIAYRDRTAVLATRHVRLLNAGGGLLAPSIVLDGRIVGTWRRALSRTEVAIEIDRFPGAPRSAARPIADAVERYATFLGLPSRHAYLEARHPPRPPRPRLR